MNKPSVTRSIEMDDFRAIEADFEVPIADKILIFRQRLAPAPDGGASEKRRIELARQWRALVFEKVDGTLLPREMSEDDKAKADDLNEEIGALAMTGFVDRICGWPFTRGGESVPITAENVAAEFGHDNPSLNYILTCANETRYPKRETSSN